MIREDLEENGFICKDGNQLWTFREEQKSDVSDSELLKQIEKLNDRSVLSTEVRELCHNKENLYYLGEYRSSFLRTFIDSLKGKILEIGAGAGAVTRYLGETGAEVVALENNYQLAKCAAARVIDLKNVNIVVSEITPLKFKSKFDVIVIIDTLENINYFQGNNSYYTLLKYLKTFLTPNGIIITAISNPFGLQYFAGSSLLKNRTMTSIEGRTTRPTCNQIKNWFDKLGLLNQSIFIPSPNHITASSIISEKALDDKNFDAPSIMIKGIAKDLGNPSIFNFSPELAIPQLYKRKAIKEYANSYIIVASQSQFISDGYYASYYTLGRKKTYCRETVFKKNNSDKLNVYYKKEKTNQLDNKKQILEYVCPDKDEYIIGESLIERFIDVLSSDDRTYSDLSKLIKSYIEVINMFLKKENIKQEVKGTYDQLPANFFDYIPSNIIVDSEYHAIDKEWLFNGTLELGFLIFRICLSLINTIHRFGNNFTKGNVTREEFIYHIFKGINYKLSEEDLERYSQFEAKIQFQITGIKDDNIFVDLENILPSYNLSEAYEKNFDSYKKISEQYKTIIANQNTKISELEMYLSILEDKNKNILAENNELNFLKNLYKTNYYELNLIKNSVLWRCSEKVYKLLNIVPPTLRKNLRRGVKLAYWTLTPWKTLKRIRYLYNKHNGIFPTHDINSQNIFDSFSNNLNFIRERIAAFIPELKLSDEQASVYLQNIKEDFSKKIIFEKYQKPKVSIIIPVYNQFKFTYNCLKSISLLNDKTSFEIIIADDNSTDKTANINKYISGIKIVKNTLDKGFLNNCNNAIKHASGDYIYFLNNDTALFNGAIDNLVSTFELFKNIGIVGSKLIYPDFSLQEAGGIIWNDASGWNFGRCDDPVRTIYKYTKEVDYVSGASLMIKKDLLTEIGGFDTRYTPAYYEDTDLAFEVRKRGYKVIFQPRSIVMHYEGKSCGTDLSSGVKAYQNINKDKFQAKWKNELEKQYSNGENVFLAKDRGKDKKTILFFDHMFPTFDQDAGSRNIFYYIKWFVEQGYNVKFIPMNAAYKMKYTDTFEKMGIECIYGNEFAVDTCESWFKENGKYIDYVYVNRAHVLEQFINKIRTYTNAKVFLNVCDLSHLRLKTKREAGLDVREDEILEAEKLEKQMIKLVDSCTSVSEEEVDYINKEISNNAIWTPIFFYNSEELNRKVPSFLERDGILFVGGFNHPPNLDAVTWFINDIYPQFLAEVNEDIKFHIAGSNPPTRLNAMSNDKIIVHGMVSDEKLKNLYNTVRVIIIPLRYGGGLKGKTLEAMYNYVPFVGTKFAIQGFPEKEAFFKAYDDAVSFKDRLVQLYTSKEIWDSEQNKYYNYIKKYFSDEYAKKTMNAIFK